MRLSSLSSLLVPSIWVCLISAFLPAGSTAVSGPSASTGTSGGPDLKARGAAVLAAESAAVRFLGPAEAARRAEDWPEAARLFDMLAAENPSQGRFFLESANARYRMGDWASAAEAFGQAAELGFERGVCLYNRACCLSLLGRTEDAVGALEEAIRSGLQDREQLLRTDHDLDAIRGTALFETRILPTPPPPEDRVTGWRVDLAYLDRRVRETHWSPFRVLPESEWEAELRALSDAVSTLDDSAVVARLMKLVARIGDGHTAVWPWSNGGWHVVPAEFYAFTDGLFVLAAAPEYEDAVGGRVVRIGDVSVEEALSRAESVSPRDNPMTLRWIAPRLLSVLEVLEGLEITEGVDGLDVEIEGPTGSRRTVHFAAVPYHWMHGTPPNYVTMAREATSPTPLWRRAPHDHYWAEYVPEDGLTYCQFAAVRNRDHGPSLAEFTAALFDSLATRPEEPLVIDVRRNNGGNNFLLAPLLDAIRATPAMRERGHLFVIIGRSTFSACQNFVNRLDWDIHPIFVGEPTGSRPNFVGEDNPIVLPWSGLTVSASSRYWQDALSEDKRIWIAPDLLAEMSSQDFRTNRDPAMDAIRAFLARRRAEPK
ncbi:MAG: hypothetical protein KDA27_18570 [Candidatus Eisenbacteria bacterium]|uniref:Tetratricopeptide repeat protein n=1 Tax=Eiseniibacteriota bacterium TaxID=2212470 RepID=A0A956NEB7_UNCEI|nr:hypothetical protein [Candidatus Eisenbacteria bacterium]MCB9463714.1 hypothetical protein [Candidatus Eisenbacteria bacterium]